MPPESAARATFAGVPRPAAAVLTVAVLLVGLPWLRTGWFARGDMVLLPQLPFSDAALGVDAPLPRNLPSDLLAAALSWLPLGIGPRLLLFGILMFAAIGAARLLPGPTSAPAAAAGIGFLWNPFVYERLAAGQWALLVGYAALPWLIGSIVRSPLPDRSGRIAVVVGCLGGATASLLLAAAAAAALVSLRRPPAAWLRWIAWFLAGAAAWAVVAILRRDAVVDPVGFSVFAPRADTPFGTWASLFTLGGFWNADAAPPGRQTLLVALLVLSLTVAAVAAAFIAARRGGDHSRVASTALVVGGFGLVMALLSTVPAIQEALGDVAATVPGLGLLRDGQKWIALWALPFAVGMGCLVAAAERRWSPVAWLGVVAPIALLPVLAAGLFGRLVPVTPPVTDWRPALDAMAAEPVQSVVLSLPWEPFRATTWSDTTVLDPLTKFAKDPVVWNDAVRVGEVVVPGESRVARQAQELFDAGESPVAVARAVGARWIWLDPAGFESRTELDGAQLVVQNDSVRLYRVTAPDNYSGRRVSPLLAWFGVMVWTVAAVLAVAIRPRQSQATEPGG